MSPNLRLRAALCLALSLANAARAHADEPVPARHDSAADGDENPCVNHSRQVQAWRTATHEVKVAERALERLEAEPVMASEGRCSDAAFASGRCRDTHYDREHELEQARDRLEDAQQKVSQVEESARIEGVPDLCLVD